MTAYLGWWIAGGVVGLAAGAWMLRRAGELHGRTLVVFAVAALGCLYGAKLQYRWRFEPLWSAAIIPPGELLSAGFHLPLGLVVGFVTAMCAAALLRAAPLRLADALAFAGAVMMPIGRVGCLVTGCCLGTVCPAWWPFGTTFGPDTAVYATQVAAGTIAAGATASLPVHPLALYFAALGATAAALETWVLRRNARPGTIAAVGFAVYPLGQLVIEQLRTPEDDRGPLMTAALLAMVVGDVIAVAVLRRRARRRGVALPIRPALSAGAADHARLAAATGIAVLALVTCAAHAATAEVDPDRWSAALAQYARDPVESRGALIVLGRRADPASLTPLQRLALADAHLRSGHLRTAGRLFDAVVDDDAAGAWRQVAAVGSGWVAVGRGRMDDARRIFTAVSGTAEQDDDLGLLGDFMVGMIDAGRGDLSALERFTRVASASNAPDGLRAAAGMADGYARFWSGDDAGAAAAFANVATDADGGPFMNEARYGAALAAWRDGDVAGATSTLRELEQVAEDQRHAHDPRALARLDPHAMIRASARRYRRLPFRMPTEQVVGMMRADVRSLAGEALRRLAAGEPAPRPLTERRGGAGSGVSSLATAAGRCAATAAAASTWGGGANVHLRRAAGGLVLLTVAAAVAAWMLVTGGRRPRGARRP